MYHKHFSQANFLRINITERRKFLKIIPLHKKKIYMVKIETELNL